MRRSFSILLWILLGALASGTSLGYFFYKANHDRQRLAEELETATLTVQQTKAESVRLAQEASSTIALALAQLDTYQKQSQAYQTLLQQAAVPPKPDANTLKYWSTAYSLPLGIALRVPPGSDIRPYNGTEAPTLSISSLRYGTWMRAETFREKTLASSTAALRTTEPISYLINGQFLAGVRGPAAHDPNTIIYLLSPVFEPTFFLQTWTTPDLSERRLQEVLSTITLPS